MRAKPLVTLSVSMRHGGIVGFDIRWANLAPWQTIKAWCSHLQQQMVQ